jgi:hypothetical protein
MIVSAKHLMHKNVAIFYVKAYVFLNFASPVAISNAQQVETFSHDDIRRRMPAWKEKFAGKKGFVRN